MARAFRCVAVEGVPSSRNPTVLVGTPSWHAQTKRFEGTFGFAEASATEHRSPRDSSVRARSKTVRLAPEVIRRFRG